MLRVWGGLYLEGLIHGGAYFRSFTVFFRSRLNADFQNVQDQEMVCFPSLNV